MINIIKLNPPSAFFLSENKKKISVMLKKISREGKCNLSTILKERSVIISPTHEYIQHDVVHNSCRMVGLIIIS